LNIKHHVIKEIKLEYIREGLLGALRCEMGFGMRGGDNGQISAKRFLHLLIEVISCLLLAKGREFGILGVPMIMRKQNSINPWQIMKVNGRIGPTNT
jgi:hypothetical protein